MCSYCGCEAEPLITALMDDHAVIADLSYRTARALDSGDTGAARSLMTELSDRFRAHSLREEAGLLAELAAAGEAEGELERLLADHQRLRPLLASETLVDHPDSLRGVLTELEVHAQTEDNDLFPYALQVLPAPSWDRINQASATALTGPPV